MMNSRLSKGVAMFANLNQICLMLFFFWRRRISDQRMKEEYDFDIKLIKSIIKLEFKYWLSSLGATSNSTSICFDL